MGKNSKSRRVDLTGIEVPASLADLYSALQVTNASALENALAGETRWQREWRLASRLCRQFLTATEEMAQLAFASELGDWDKARTCKGAPEDEYTYHLWLAAQAWRLLEFSTHGSDERDDGCIDTVRQGAREGIIAVKTAASLCRTVAYQALRTETKVEDRVRGPQRQDAGTSPGVRKRRRRDGE